jgi:sugar phosphate permease
VLGASTAVIGAIEGIAEALASILKLFSGWFSDRLGNRKWLAVAGYGISALSKPFFYYASSPAAIAAARWADRVGKGVRTAPRDALVADSVTEKQRGLAFGFHRAADTAGAVVGLIVALGVVLLLQRGQVMLAAHTFRVIVLVSLIPAILAVVALAVMARDVAVKGQRAAPKFAFRSLGKQFMIFMLIVGLFDLGNSSDAFLILRAQERGMTVAPFSPC